MAEQDATPGEASPGPQPLPSPARTLSGAIPTASPPATRPPYIPQFTAATQLILKRMKGEPSSLTSALSAASAVASIPPSTYEDVKRRLVMGMNTSSSLTMQMPQTQADTQTSTQKSAGSLSIPSLRPGPTAKISGMSAIRRISSGLTASGKPVPPPKLPTIRTLSVESKVKKPKTTAVSKGAPRRKRLKSQDGESSEHSDRVEAPEPESAPPESSTPLTTTKSGRQVQKPDAYNPAAMDNTGKRKHYGKRTVEQALCKKCTRMHSPATNQMVFCDGCNDGWHQTCHEPWIDDAVVRDVQRSWFCVECVEKRSRASVGKKQKVEKAAPPPKESWAGKTPQQRRAYLMTLSNPELVSLVMGVLEVHPDLPIFPSAVEPPRSLFAGSTVEGLFPRADANPTGQMNFVRKTAGRASSSGPGRGKKGQKEKEDSQEREEDEDYDPLVRLWPKPGRGVYSSRLAVDGEHLTDDDDYEAFSVVVYDEKGRKVEENGMSGR